MKARRFIVFGLCHTEPMLIALLLFTLVQGSADGQAKKKPEGPPKKGDIVIV
jgi:hypothetical protein